MSLSESSVLSDITKVATPPTITIAMARAWVFMAHRFLSSFLSSALMSTSEAP